MPRHPSILLKIKIKQLYSTSLSLSLSLSIFLSLSLSPSLPLSISLFLSLSFSLYHSLSIYLSLSLSLYLSIYLSLPLSRSLSPSDWSEGERVACMHKQKVRACSKCSSFIQSVSIRDYYINSWVHFFQSTSMRAITATTSTLTWCQSYQTFFLRH